MYCRHCPVYRIVHQYRYAVSRPGPYRHTRHVSYQRVIGCACTTLIGSTASLSGENAVTSGAISYLSRPSWLSVNICFMVLLCVLFTVQI